MIATETVVLLLPEPPSANRWWRRHGLVMHRSRDATAYLKLVAAHYIDAEILTGPVSVNMVWHRGMKSGDLDKRIGVLLDALQGTVYVNDSQVVQLWARRCDEHPTIPKGHVLVEVSAT